MNLEKILSEKFGYTSFRPGQKEIIQMVLDGRDVFAMMPTGSGKSVCYQLPGYVMPGLVMIVSPLISLMEDQCASLRRLGEKKACALNSFLSPREKALVMERLSDARFLFISPEMLQKPAIIRRLERLAVSLFVVDEAHCISEWGHEFRPDYMRLAAIRKKIGSPPCLALTATADDFVREDIIRHLEMPECWRLIQSVDRKNIAFMVKKVDNIEEKVNTLTDIINSVKLPGIIYCSSREWTEKLTAIIRERLPLRAACYHGGMSGEDRLKIQRQFLAGELDVLCCTNAFGMGINKPDIRLIVHFHYPKHLNAYLQEIGRAGRDGEQSLAIMLYMESDDRIPFSLIEKEYPSEQLLRTILQRLDREGVPLDQERTMALMDEEGAGETAARFLWEQLSREKSRQMAVPYTALFSKCAALIKERRNRQLADLNQMRMWIREKGCRREAVLKNFHETIRDAPIFCCDACGVKLTDFACGSFSSRQIEKAPDISWEESLRQLLVADK